MLIVLCFCFYEGIGQEHVQKHTVTKGETIVTIAKKYKVTPYEIQQANEIDINTIRPDDVLIIPESTIPAPQLQELPDRIDSVETPSQTQYTVVKGDTKFSLAKRFEMTISDLESSNPQIVTGLLEGQILTVPGDQKGPKDEPQTYVVTRLDTKFGLAKKFGITIPELERQNPHIVKMLIVGQTVKVPSVENKHDEVPSDRPVKPTASTKAQKETSAKTDPKQTASAAPTKNETSQQKTAEPTLEEVSVQDPMDLSNTKYRSYEIENHDTLYALANTAGMSIPEFLKLNPQLETSVQVGTVIKMPKTTNHTNNGQAQISSAPTKYVNLANTLNTSQAKKVLFILPFSQLEFEDYGIDNDFNSVSNAFKKKHLEFYKGAQIAIDSVKKLHLKVDVEVLRVPNTIEDIKITDLAKADDLHTYDAVFAPYYKSIDADATTFTSSDKKPVITATQVTDSHRFKNLYSALPPIDLQRKQVLDYIKSQKGNIVVVSDVNREPSKAFIKKQVDDASFIDLQRNGTFSNDELISKLKKDQLNYVIIDSDRNSVFLSTTNILLGQLSNYDIRIAILESHLIPNRHEVSKKRYQILKMLFPSLSPVEETGAEKRFTSQYQKTYKILPSQNVLLGFDITYDTLLRLGQQQDFQSSAENQITEYTQLMFDYSKNTLGGYSNQGLYLLHYDSDANLKQVN